MPILTFLLSSLLLGEAELSANLSDIGIGDYDFSDADADIFHVNTNDLFQATDFINNDTVLEPQMSVAIDYESQELNKEAVNKNKVDFEDYEEMDENYLSLDSYSLHMPKFHPQMTEIEFSDWYFLFLSPLMNSSDSVVTDVENVRRGQEGFQYQLSASLASPVSKQVSRSLVEKLQVPISQFSISSVEQYKSGSLSVNLSLTSHKIPGLHQRLCHLPHKDPVFNLPTSDLGDVSIKPFKLIQVFHDKNQHLYINNNVSEMSTLESLGLLVTLTLGGLGMFLVVLVVTFVFAKMVTKTSEFERIADHNLEQYEEEEYLETLVTNNERKDIFLIEDVEGCILDKDERPSQEDHATTYDNDQEPGKFKKIRNIWHRILSGRLNENIFGSKFIELNG